MNGPLLQVKDLCVDYVSERGPVRAIDRVTLDVMPGEILGVAGESGCGKSTLAKAVMRILPPPAIITGGKVVFDGHDVLSANEEQLRALRWRDMSMVFQSAMNALNPVVSIGEQIADTLDAHADYSPDAARDRAAHLLDLVDIPTRHLESFSHQLSGGMRQRVGIALALALEPKLVILDEPTTALDVVVEREILDQISRLRDELGFAVLFITHDLARMLQVSDRVAIFYAAQLSEVGPVTAIRANAVHPYTHGLLGAYPSVVPGSRSPQSIEGKPPSLTNPPTGCRFHPRCPKVMPVCRGISPDQTRQGEGHWVRCHLAE